MDQERKRTYDALSCALDESKFKVLEIELLPSSVAVPPDANLLRDGPCIGIHKKPLIAAFIHARYIFNHAKIDDSQVSLTKLPLFGDRGLMCLQETLRATTVLLLFDPEHLTAANVRKRHFLQSADKMLVFQQELTFLESILTSPLHRQTKSPTLWHHRWWLMCQMAKTGHKIDVLRESRVVLKSGERHANNYYAFQYARRVLVQSLSTGLPGQSNLVLGETKQWCLKHPSDTSGWSYLLFLLLHTTQERESVGKAVQEVCVFAVDCRWRGEALWVFLRTTLMHHNLLSSTQRSLVESVLEKGGYPTARSISIYKPA